MFAQELKYNRAEILALLLFDIIVIATLYHYYNNHFRAHTE